MNLGFGMEEKRSEEKLKKEPELADRTVSEKLDIILTKLDLINERLKLIEEKIERRGL
jgi:hypothetical protein